jgi:hypothetical protein
MGWASSLCIGATLLGAACARLPRAPYRTDSSWLGCYLLTWTAENRTETDSVKVSLGKPTSHFHGPGFWPAWPKRSERRVMFGDTLFTGYLWSVAGDSLVLDEGFLGTQHIVLWPRSGALVGTVQVDRDYSFTRCDSGVCTSTPYQSVYPAAVVRVACPT